MHDLCVDYLTRWYQSGGDMLMWFMAGAGNWDTRYGAWELTTDLALPGTPKLQCMDTVLREPPSFPSARNKVPGTFEALAFVGNQPPYSQESALRLRYLHPGAMVEYLVQAPESATYSLVIRSEAEQLGNSIELAVNSTIVAPKFELVKSGWGMPVDNPPIQLKLDKGLNTLRLTTKTEKQGFILSGFRVY
jgi:hypothetical protein